MEFQNDYRRIIQNSQKALALNWIQQKVFNKIKIDDEQLAKMSVEEYFRLRRQRALNRDIKSLLTIAKYRFMNGSAATNESNFPEMCYYYGRLHRGEELKIFLEDNQFHLFMLPESCKELAQNLLTIGYKFPHLSEKEISYLEEKYCNSKTFELFDIIMFDSDQLARPIKKFNKDSLNVKNSNFSRDFLLKVYDCFSENEELDSSYDELNIYSRIKNEIILKRYEDTGLGEYYINQPILSNEFFSLMTEKHGEECSDYFARALSHNEDWEDFKKSDFYLLNADSIEEVANEYFFDSSKVNNVKADVAKFWLDKINSREIRLV